ncbi:MAG: hypothetical protein ABJA50_03830 [Chloroflexota bacterium]
MASGIHARPLSGTLRLLLAVLIVLSTGLFVLGVVVEHNGNGASGENTESVILTGSNTPTAAIPQQSGETGTSGESGENAEAHAGEQAQATVVPHQEAGEAGVAKNEGIESNSETVLGINLENPWIVAAFAVGWLVLLIALFLLGRIARILILVAASASVIFDIAEIAHQIGRSNTLVATIAVLVAAAHLALALLAVMALMGRMRPVPTSPTAG